MSAKPHSLESGPFRAHQLREGDPYELSNGHAILCLPSGTSHGGSNLAGGEALDTDPDVEWAGVDVGYSPEPGTLRAADVVLGRRPEEKDGWAAGAPRLAVEYAGKGQDEDRLQEKIQDFFAAGTEIVWVVRLLGPRRVEVYEPEQPVRVRNVGEELTAPGILRNPVPVLALYDRDAAHEVVLRNLLQRRGYEDLEAVKALGAAESVLALLESRGMTVSDEARSRVLGCRDLDLLKSWLVRAASVGSVAEIFSRE